MNSANDYAQCAWKSCGHAAVSHLCVACATRAIEHAQVDMKAERVDMGISSYTRLMELTSDEIKKRVTDVVEDIRRVVFARYEAERQKETHNAANPPG